MLPYYFICLLLAGFAFASEAKALAYYVGLASAVVLTLFAGLRFETGYDWIEYGRQFQSTPDLISMFKGQSIFPSHAEPAFVLLNSVVKTLGGGIYTLFFLVSLISVGVINVVCGRIAPNTAVMWLVYFGIVFMTSQMTMLRQALASSFVLLSLLMVAENRKLPALTAILTAIGFHTSAIMYVVVMILARIRPRFYFTMAFIAVGLIFVIFKVNMFMLIEYLAIFSPSRIAYKILFYSSLKEAPVTLGSVALIMFHLSILVGLYILPSNRRDPFVSIGIWLTLAVLFAHLYVWNFPNLWNRVMQVSLPWEIAVIWRVWRSELLFKGERLAAVAALFVFSAGALAYSLSKPGALPFVPYQFIPVAVATGNCGSAEKRIQTTQNLEYLTPKSNIPEAAAKAEIDRLNRERYLEAAGTIWSMRQSWCKKLGPDL